MEKEKNYELKEAVTNAIYLANCLHNSLQKQTKAYDCEDYVAQRLKDELKTIEKITFE